VQPGLPRARTRAFEQRGCLETPATAERPSEAFGWMVATLELPRAVGRDIRDDVYRRPLDVSDDELGSEVCDPAEPVLLPGAQQRPGRPGVGDGRARRGEREPPAGAFAAAFDRPGGRCAAAGAARRRECPERTAAIAAQHVG